MTKYKTKEKEQNGSCLFKDSCDKYGCRQCIDYSQLKIISESDKLIIEYDKLIEEIKELQYGSELKVWKKL